LQKQFWKLSFALLKKIILLLSVYCVLLSTNAQEFDSSPSIGLLIGAVNYQGDLKPNSFTFQHSNLLAGISVRKPFNRWFAARAGVAIGKIEADDKFNRPYLQVRNLNFTSSIKELYAALEVDLLDIDIKKFSPYLYGGGNLFHFNPYTYDIQNNKVYLQPLVTEGQGLSQYPDRKPYQLTQFALAFGGGLRIALSSCSSIAIEFSQRKTFTDYLDDVSTSYVDANVLRSAKGQQSVDLAYRGDELGNGNAYPANGDQRGTPTEMDWYYFVGLHAEFKLSCFGSLFSGNGGSRSIRQGYYKNCPKVF